MAVNEARRHHLYECARRSWDEDAAETLMESMVHPAVELATKRDIADLRAEMHSLIRAQTGWLVGAVALIVGFAEAIGRFG